MVLADRLLPVELMQNLLAWVGISWVGILLKKNPERLAFIKGKLTLDSLT